MSIHTFPQKLDDVYTHVVITRNRNGFLSEILFSTILDNAPYIQGYREGIEVISVSESFINNVKSTFTGFLTHSVTHTFKGIERALNSLAWATFNSHTIGHF